MGMLNKEEVLFERDNKGELLPLLVDLATIEGDKQVRLVPMTKGDLAKLNTLGLDEESMILNHCFEPKFTKEELPFMKSSKLTDAIIIAILAISTDRNQEEIQEMFTKTKDKLVGKLIEEENDFSKKKESLIKENK